MNNKEENLNHKDYNQKKNEKIRSVNLEDVTKEVDKIIPKGENEKMREILLNTTGLMLELNHKIKCSMCGNEGIMGTKCTCGNYLF